MTPGERSRQPVLFGRKRAQSEPGPYRAWQFSATVEFDRFAGLSNSLQPHPDGCHRSLDSADLAGTIPYLGNDWLSVVPSI